MEQKILRSVGVHDGMFHADEVTACALLVLFNCVDQDKIIRTREPAMLARCEYVCDVGGIYDPEKKLFDHHQVTYQGPLSSAGMILLYLRDQAIIDEEEYVYFLNALIKGVDEHDNGKAPQLNGTCTFSLVIANFAPTEYGALDDELNRCFFQAFAFALGHLQRLHQRFVYNRSCQEIVANEMAKNKRCLIFDTPIPWLESFFALGGKDHPALFVIMPSQSHWKLRGIPPDLDHRMQVRVAMPIEWAGLLEKELQDKSGIAGAIFCHKGRFISVWETKDEALLALKKILKEKGIDDAHIV